MEDTHEATIDTATPHDDSRTLPSAPEMEKERDSPSNSINAKSEDVSRSLTDNLVCPICLDLFSDAVVLNCGHTFCFRCISLHMRRQDSCPADRILITLITKNMAVRQVVDIIRPNHNTNSKEANDPALAIQLGQIPPLPPGEEEGPEPAMDPADVPPDPQIVERLVEHHPIDGMNLTQMRRRTKFGVFVSTASIFLLTAGLEHFGGKNMPSVFPWTWNPIVSGIVSAIGGFFMAAATEGFLEDMVEPHVKASVENGRFRFFTWLFVHAPTIYLASQVFSYRMIIIPPLVYLELAALRGMFGWNHTFAKSFVRILACALSCTAVTWKLLL
eukprot:TRINITY_DN8001_c0_g1_i1.p1 TRINITY_DN8001_c0_g1~~TRINITY_DN8001_c0_g1_i1.p1  ORF type:complete len:330 (+),score=48.39 TRINITY_DN8001_c0_g1_i1:34-1023(+)